MQNVTHLNCTFKSCFEGVADSNEAWQISMELLQKLLGYSEVEAFAYLKGDESGRLFAEDILEVLGKGVPLTASIGIATRLLVSDN